MVYLWRAVDHEVDILESFITKKREKSVAMAFLKMAPKRHGAPAAGLSNELISYRVATTTLAMPTSRRVVSTPTNVPKMASCRSEDEGGRCWDSGE